jgi:hypothetical protein
VTGEIATSPFGAIFTPLNTALAVRSYPAHRFGNERMPCAPIVLVENGNYQILIPPEQEVSLLSLLLKCDLLIILINNQLVTAVKVCWH